VNRVTVVSVVKFDGNEYAGTEEVEQYDNMNDLTAHMSNYDIVYLINKQMIKAGRETARIELLHVLKSKRSLAGG